MPRIVVTGKAEHHQAAERGTLHLQVAFTRPSAEEAIRLAGERHADVVARLRTMVEKGDVTWWSAENIVAGAVYEAAPDLSGKVLRFRAAADLTAKFRDFDALAQFSAAVAVEPGVEVGHVDWTLTQVRLDEVIPMVRASAARDALRRAQEYADGLSLGPVRLAAVYEEGLRPNVYGSEMVAAGIKARFGAPVPGPDTLLHPEEVTISATLTADFDADPL